MADFHGITRRRFLEAGLLAGAGTAFGIALQPPRARAGGTGIGGAKTGGEINAWVLIGADNAVTLRIPQAEIGQGVVTTLAQLLAEELHLDPRAVRTEFFDPTFNMLHGNVYGYTATVASLSADRLWGPARIGAAQVRSVLVEAAARRFGAAAADLQVERAHVVDRSSGRSASFASLAPAAAALPLPDPATIGLQRPDQWRWIGKSVPRLDTHAKVTGAAVFGIDVRLPGMKFAAIRQSPVFGGRLASFDPAAIAAQPGVRAVLKVAAGRAGLNEPVDLGADDWGMDDAVAVVADDWWTAARALEKLPIEWQNGRTAGCSSQAVRADMTYRLEQGGYPFRADGDAAGAFAAAATTLEADYWYPYMEHAALEPMNCTARFDAGRLELWAPTQFADEAVRVAAHATGIAIPQIKLHLTYIGGGFGRRICNDYVSQAAQLAVQMPGVPIQLLWSREETMRHGYYPAPAAGRFRGGLDRDGRLIAWSCRSVFAKKVDQSYAAARIPQTIPNLSVEFATVDSPVPFGWMRGVSITQFLWMNQGFMDELAHAARRDPLEFQLALLDERALAPSWSDKEYELARVRALRRVLQEVGVRAAWGGGMAPGRGRGLAVSDFSYWSGYNTSATAAVAEVTLDADGWFKVDRVVVVMECGVVINPDVVKAQLEGGVAWALSTALYSEITIAGGRVEQGNFDDYPILRIAEMPRVETHILPSDKHPSGVGEVAVPVPIAAVVNAIHAAGGPRIRSLPIVRHKPLTRRT